MADETDDPRVEKVARELAHWHGSAFSHSNREGEMQTVASSYAGHRWARASDEYANAKWKQYRGAAKCAIAMVDAEREACAELAYASGLEGAEAYSHIVDAIRARSTEA